MLYNVKHSLDSNKLFRFNTKRTPLLSVLSFYFPLSYLSCFLVFYTPIFVFFNSILIFLDENSHRPVKRDVHAKSSRLIKGKRNFFKDLVLGTNVNQITALWTSLIPTHDFFICRLKKNCDWYNVFFYFRLLQSLHVKSKVYLTRQEKRKENQPNDFPVVNILSGV